MGSLRERLRGEVLAATWDDLAPHLDRGALLIAAADLDLVEAGCAIAGDDAEAVGTWIREGRLHKPAEGGPWAEGGAVPGADPAAVRPGAAAPGVDAAPKTRGRARLCCRSGEGILSPSVGVSMFVFAVVDSCSLDSDFLDTLKDEIPTTATATTTPGTTDTTTPASATIVCYPGGTNDYDACLETSELSSEFEDYEYPPPLDGDPLYAAPTRFLDLEDLETDLEITRHFVLGELAQIEKGRWAVLQLHAVERLHDIRRAIGPVTITSAYRGPAYNDDVGGVTYSRHMYGDGFDMVPLEATLDDLVDACEAESAGFIELYENHVHCDWRDDALDTVFYPSAATARRAGVAHAPAFDPPPHAASLRAIEGPIAGSRIWTAPATGWTEGEPLARVACVLGNGPRPRQRHRPHLRPPHRSRSDRGVGGTRRPNPSLPVISAALLPVWVVLGGCAPSDPAMAEPPAPPAAPSKAPHPPIPPDSVVQTILAQAVLDHPAVAPYLHTEIASNLPLAVHAAPALADGAAALQAGGAPVRVVATPGAARIRFVARESLPEAGARIRFAIDAEGVSGHVDLTLRDFVWTATDARVVER